MEIRFGVAVTTWAQLLQLPQLHNQNALHAISCERIMNQWLSIGAVCEMRLVFQQLLQMFA